MPYLSASAVVIHYEEALYQVHAPLPLPFGRLYVKQENTENVDVLGHRLLGSGVDPLKHASPCVCYHTVFSPCTLEGVGISRGTPKLGALGSRHLGIRDVADPLGVSQAIAYESRGLSATTAELFV